MEKKVISVLGPISPEAMGFTDAHNHLWIAPLQTQVEDTPVLHQERLILDELLLYQEAGGTSQVDCQPGGAGRDGNKLKTLSKASNVNVIACTGFHLWKYYPDDSGLWNLDVDQAADYFSSEIFEGMEETRENDQPVHPGFIKIAVRDDIEKSPLKLIEAAVATSILSGYLIEMHTEKGSNVEKFVELLISMGMSLDRLVICHIDKRPDLELHKELAQAGCTLEYDTFFRPKYNPDKNLWKLVFEMIGAGYQKSIVFATDLADRHLWETMGNGPGLAGFITQIKNRLEKEDLEQEIIFNLMGRNIANRLAVNYKEQTV